MTSTSKLQKSKQVHEIRLIPRERVDPIDDTRIKKLLEVIEYEEKQKNEMLKMNEKWMDTWNFKGEYDEVNKLHQDILCAVGVHEVLLSAIQIPFCHINGEVIDKLIKDNNYKESSAEFYDKIRNNEAEFYDNMRNNEVFEKVFESQMCIREVVALAAKTLSIMCRGNEAAQQKLFGSVETILDVLEESHTDDARRRFTGWKYYPYGEKQNGVDMLELVEARILELLAAIFMGNEKLCKRAPDRLYTSIAKYMGSDHAQMHEGASCRRFMRVYQVLASSGDVHVCHKVAEYLVEGLPGHTTSPLHVEQIAEDKEDERIYQKNLISILSFCCAPPSTWTAYVSTKVSDGQVGGDKREAYTSLCSSLQASIPLKTIIELIKHKTDNITQAKDRGKTELMNKLMWEKASYLRLMTALYLNEAVLHRETRYNANLPDVIKELMDKVVQDKHLKEEDRSKVVIFGYLPAIYTYWSNAVDQNEQSQPLPGITWVRGETFAEHTWTWKGEGRERLKLTGSEFIDFLPKEERLKLRGSEFIDVLPKDNTFRVDAKNDTKLGFDDVRKAMLSCDAMIYASEGAENELEDDRKILRELKKGSFQKFGGGKLKLINYLVHEFQMIEHCVVPVDPMTQQSFWSMEMSEKQKKLKTKIKKNLQNYPPYEKIVERMIMHVNSYLNVEVHSGHNTTEINVHIMELLRAIISAENESSSNNIDSWRKKQKDLAEKGAMDLVLRVLSYAEEQDAPTITAALKLGREMLKGGNRDVQDIILKYFMNK